MKRIVCLILAVILLGMTIPLPAAQGQVSYPDSIHFERVAEGPTYARFSVEVTGPSGSIWQATARLTGTNFSPQVAIMPVQSVRDVVKIIEKPVMAARDLTLKDVEKYLKNADSPKSKQALDLLAVRKGKGQVNDDSPKFDFLPDIAEVSELIPNKVNYVAGWNQEEKTVKERTPQATITHGNSFELRPGSYELTVKYPANKKGISWHSKGLLTLDIGGKSFFDNSNSSWWDNSWGYRNTLSFKASSLSGNLSNFPVAVYLDSTKIDFAKIKAGGADIRFVDSDDSTELSHEVEYWDDGAETAQLWVKIPQINNSDYLDYIYIYYGNAAASDASDSAATWTDTGAVAVFHFGENSGFTAGDSTSGGNDATLTGATWNGHAMSIAGGSQYAVLANESNFDFQYSDDQTLLAFIKTSDTAVGTGDIISKMTAGGQPGYNFRFTTTASGYPSQYFLAVASPLEGFKLTSTTATNTNAWRQVVSTYDGSNLETGFKTYVDATSVAISGPDSPTTSSWLNNDPIGIMTSQYGASDYTGLVDEVRIYNRVLTADEVRANYLSYMDTLLYYGSEDPPPSVTTLAVTDAALDYNGSHATLRGNLTGLGGAPEVTIKWQWGYAADSLTNETATQVKTATGIYSTTISHFFPTGTIYYRFVGTNTDGTAYGSVMSFTTTLPAWYRIATFIPLFAVLAPLAVGILLARDGDMTLKKWLAIFVTLIFSLVVVGLVVSFVAGFH